MSVTFDAFCSLYGWADSVSVAESIEPLAKRRGSGFRLVLFSGPGLLLLLLGGLFGSYWAYRRRDSDKARELQSRLKSGWATTLDRITSGFNSPPPRPGPGIPPLDSRPAGTRGRPQAGSRLHTQAADPTTPAHVLGEIAGNHPDLRPVVANNPASGPGLLSWLRSLRDPAIDAALERRSQPDSTRRAARFNPPPGWPIPHSGWTPTPDWKPDPSWPQAPPGWQFWVA